jgi:hypothetical protein
MVPSLVIVVSFLRRELTSSDSIEWDVAVRAPQKRVNGITSLHSWKRPTTRNLIFTSTAEFADVPEDDADS